MIYLDHAASTPVCEAARSVMMSWLGCSVGHVNAASDHRPGRQALRAVEQARQQVAGLVQASPDEIIWTSGATESNNLAIKGAIEFNALGDCHVITSRIEHRCVLESCRSLEQRTNPRVMVSYLKPEPSGAIDPQQVLDAITPKTQLVSLMWVNNEIGSVTDIPRLANALADRGVMLHVDAAQAAGKLLIDLSSVPVSLLSLSAHKFGGPQGIGALFVRRRPRSRVAAQLHGGGHEQGMRSGTLPVHQILGMGAASAEVDAELDQAVEHMRQLRERMAERLLELPGVTRNGSAPQQAPHILNLSFDGVNGESLRASLDGLAVSSGSACTSASSEPSYVLRSLGRDDELANASLRFSFSPMTEIEEVDQAAEQVREQVQRLRALSPRGDL